MLRNITAIKLPIAFLVAFTIYYFFPNKSAYWSLVTIAAITQVGFENTVSKSLMRLIGTLVGAFLGYGLALLVGKNQLLVTLVFFGFSVLTSLFAVQKNNYNYAGVIAGVTLVIILAINLTNGELAQAAFGRTAEVLLGIAILLVINIILLSLLEPKARNWHYFLSDIRTLFPSSEFLFRKNQWLAAVKIALASTFILCVWLFFNIPEGFWAIITCFLIMEESVKATKTKASYRILAHFLVALLGLIWTLCFGQYEWSLIVVLLIAGYCFGYLIGLKNRYSSMGNTMAIALVIMLLAAPGTETTLETIIIRFLNVMFGVIVAVLISHFCFRTNVIKE